MTTVYRTCVILTLILLLDAAAAQDATDTTVQPPTTATTTNATTPTTTTVVPTTAAPPPPCNASLIENCANCTMDGQTPKCVECKDYYGPLNATTCKLCNITIPNCVRCNTFNVSDDCIICSPGFGLNSTKQCGACDVNCNDTLCMVAGMCTGPCKPGYSKNGSESVCTRCTTGCDRCTKNPPMCDAGGCSIGYYFNASQCTAQSSCGVAIANCTECYDVEPGKNGTCRTCNASAGFYLADDNTHCRVCKEAIPNCEPAKCKQAKSQGEHPTCDECEERYGPKDDSKSCALCTSEPKVSENCSRCTLNVNNTKCTKCDEGFSPNATYTCIVCQNLISKCAVCDRTQAICSRCVAGYGPTPENRLCEACEVGNCNNCTATRKECDTDGCKPGYVLNEHKQCKEQECKGFDAASFVGGIVLGCCIIIIIVVVSRYCRKRRGSELSYSQF